MLMLRDADAADIMMTEKDDDDDDRDYVDGEVTDDDGW